MRPYGPLRGRDQELARALGIVRRTRVHGASGVVLITGEPGIGKTALLSEICRQAAHSRIRVARSKCDEIEQASPGAPVIGLLRTGRDPLLTGAEFHDVAGLAGEPLVLRVAVRPQTLVPLLPVLPAQGLLVDSGAVSARGPVRDCHAHSR